MQQLGLLGGGRQLYLPLEPVVSSDLMSTGATSELMSLFTSEPRVGFHQLVIGDNDAWLSSPLLV